MDSGIFRTSKAHGSAGATRTSQPDSTSKSPTGESFGQGIVELKGHHDLTVVAPQSRAQGRTAEILGDKPEPEIEFPELEWSLSETSFLGFFADDVSVLKVDSDDKLVQKHAKEVLRQMMERYSYSGSNVTITKHASGKSGIELHVKESGGEKIRPGCGRSLITIDEYFKLLSALQIKRSELERDIPLLRNLRHGNVQLGWQTGKAQTHKLGVQALKTHNNNYNECRNTVRCIEALTSSGRVAAACTLLEDFKSDEPPLYIEGGRKGKPEDWSSQQFYKDCKERSAKDPKLAAELKEYDKSLFVWKQCENQQRDRLLLRMPENISPSFLDGFDIRGLTCILLCCSPGYYDPVSAAHLLLSNPDFGVRILPEQITVTEELVHFFAELPYSKDQKLKQFERHFGIYQSTTWYKEVAQQIKGTTKGSKDSTAGQDLRKALDEAKRRVKKGGYSIMRDMTGVFRLHPPTGQERQTADDRKVLRQLALAAMQVPDSSMLAVDAIRQLQNSGFADEVAGILQSLSSIAGEKVAKVLKDELGDLLQSSEEKQGEIKQKLATAEERLKTFGWNVVNHQLHPIAESEENTKDAISSREEVRALFMLALNAAQLPGEVQLASDVLKFLRRFGRATEARHLYGVLQGIATFENKEILRKAWSDVA
jgi:hypothetical protein